MGLQLQQQTAENIFDKISENSRVPTYINKPNKSSSIYIVALKFDFNEIIWLT